MARSRLLSSTSLLPPHVVPGPAFLAIFVRRYRPICALLVISAFVAFVALAHPELNKKTQVLEHALQPGMELLDFVFFLLIVMFLLINSLL